MNETRADRLEFLKQRRAQLDARIAKLGAHRRADERRRDTRRKIIAGAILLEAVERDRASGKPSGIAQWWDLHVEKVMRAQDRALFKADAPPLAGAERSDAS
jgi:hypothetical protein